MIQNKQNSLIGILTTCLFASFFVFTSSGYGSLILAVEAAMILLVTALEDRGKIVARVTYFHVYMLIFSAFCFLSAMWAWDAGKAITNGTTIMEILICLTAVYLYYQRLGSVDALLKVIMWGGNVVMLSVVAFHGPEQIVSILLSGRRIPSELINSNTLGILAAICTIINLHYILTDKRLYWWNLFVVLAVIMVAVSGSRKAFLFIALGCFLMFALKNIQGKKGIGASINLIVTVAVFVVVGYMVLMLPMFANLRGRLAGLLAAIFDESGADHSSLVRQKLVELGIAQFKKTPILGIGMGCSNMLVVMSNIGEDYYLHNNFVELLASGGIVGFACFYSMYAYLLIQMWKLRTYRDGEYAVILTLLVVLIIMDYGMVSYYSKSSYFYLMVLFLYVQTLKRKKREGASNAAR